MDKKTIKEENGVIELAKLWLNAASLLLLSWVLFTLYDFHGALAQLSANTKALSDITHQIQDTMVPRNEFNAFKEVTNAQWLGSHERMSLLDERLRILERGK